MLGYPSVSDNNETQNKVVFGGMLDRRQMLMRPTKSAANKYRHMIHGGGAIEEEGDYNGSKVQLGSGLGDYMYTRAG